MIKKTIEHYDVVNSTNQQNYHCTQVSVTSQLQKKNSRQKKPTQKHPNTSQCRTSEKQTAQRMEENCEHTKCPAKAENRSRALNGMRSTGREKDEREVNLETRKTPEMLQTGNRKINEQQNCNWSDVDREAIVGRDAMKTGRTGMNGL